MSSRQLCIDGMHDQFVLRDVLNDKIASKEGHIAKQTLLVKCDVTNSMNCVRRRIVDKPHVMSLISNQKSKLDSRFKLVILARLRSVLLKHVD